MLFFGVSLPARDYFLFSTWVIAHDGGAVSDNAGRRHRACEWSYTFHLRRYQYAKISG